MDGPAALSTGQEVAMKEKVLVAQACLTLSNLIDCGPPSSSVHGILQARILERVTIPFSREGLPDPGTKPQSPTVQAYFLPSEPPDDPKRSNQSILKGISPECSLEGLM